SAKVFYMLPGESSFHEKDMNLVTGSTSIGTWEVVLPEPKIIGKLMYYFRVNDTAENVNTTTIFSVNVTHGDAATLSLSISATEVIAGQPFSVLCTAKDSYENTVENYSGQVSLSTSDKNPVAIDNMDTHQFSVADKGTYEFSNLLLCTAPEQWIRAVDIGSPSLCGNITTTVEPGEVRRLGLYPMTSTMIAGLAAPFTVKLLDEFNNTAMTAHPLNVALQSSSPTGHFQPDNELLIETGSSSEFFLYTDTTMSTTPYTLTALNQSLDPGYAEVSVVNSSVDRWRVSPSFSQLVAGSSVSLVIELLDRFNNTVILDQNATLALFTSSSSGSFYQDGAAVTQVVIHAGEDQAMVNYTDFLVANSPAIISVFNGSSVASGIAFVNTTHSSPHHFLLRGPREVRAGETFDFTTVLQDVYGNRVLNCTAQVTFEIGSHTTTGNMSLAENGALIFQSLSITRSGVWPVRVSAFLNGWVNGTGTITVQHGAVDGFNVSGPEEVVAGVAFSLVVSAIDPWWNVVRSYNGTVDCQSTDTYPASLPDQCTYGADDYGSRLFVGIVLFTVPRQAISFFDVEQEGVTGSIEIMVSDLTPPELFFDPASDLNTEGDSWCLVVQAHDDVSIREVKLHHSFDNITFMSLNMTQQDGNLTTGIGGYSIKLDSSRNPSLYFYFSASDGQNTVFLRDTRGHPFVKEGHWGLDLTFLLILVVILSLIILTVVAYLFRKQRD
ncbi:MAG: hypothetical protein KAX31_07220, partial [Thermoplasmata archaeon]|nr:hypothetical protein [Thermoplasmata archaeon]